MFDFKKFFFGRDAEEQKTREEHQEQVDPKKPAEVLDEIPDQVEENESGTDNRDIKHEQGKRPFTEED
ncbi:hypothetical protein HOB10_00105 [Candidatus Parcubacteria bacterium]|mgnify:CR=1 FL=1|jgi:hypothetical protein|nr:hypothetical protein [Candidatus Parcubacteria bacterium]